MESWNPTVSGVDLDIFDPSQLDDAFGRFDENAADFVLGFLGTVQSEIDAINQAFERNDDERAWALSHAMKGAAASTGTRRLGRVMHEIQDSLDDDDPDLAEIYREGLRETFEEVNNALGELRRVLRDEMVDDVARS